MTTPLGDHWDMLADEVLSGMRDWRTAHPRATLHAIETELDARLARLRAQMLQDTALTSPATDWADQPLEQQPVCPDCDQPLRRRGTHTRQLRSHHNQPVLLPRQYGTCPRCERGFFPPR
jgi:hypothetical protein